MGRVIGFGLLGIIFCLYPAPLRADVIVESSLSLTGLQITPASGSAQLQSPFAASAFAQAQDSLGRFAQQFNTIDDAATSASSLLKKQLKQVT